MKRLMFLTMACAMCLVPKSPIIALPSAASDPPRFERIEGIGADRANLTPELLADRSEKIVDAMEFYLMRYGEAFYAPQRIFDPSIWSIMEREAEINEVDPFLLGAIAYVESFGLNHAVSPTGPVGMFQFTKGSMKGTQMKIWKQTLKEESEKLVWTGRGKDRRQVVKRVTVKRTVTIDDRRDPEKSTRAAAERLRLYYDLFGRWDFAIQQHHDGPGRVMDLLRKYTGKKFVLYQDPKKPKQLTAKEVIESDGLTLPKIFFDNTPYHNPEVFQYLEKIPDFGKTYFFRVMQAYRLLQMYQENPLGYAALHAKYQTPFKADGFPASRMWTYYTRDDMSRLAFADLGEIQTNKDSRLVSLPEPWAQFGFTVRTSGKSPIAEMDPDNRPDYIKAEISSIGQTLYVMDEVRRLWESNPDPRKKPFTPYEITSAVRTAEIQDRLCRINFNACTSLPTHILGKAMDIGMKGIDKDRRRDLLFILQELDYYDGMISYVPESGQDTIHTVPDPEWEDFYAQAYYSFTKTPQIKIGVEFAANTTD